MVLQKSFFRWYLLLPIGIIATMVLLSRYMLTEQLAIAITIDLLITMPLLYFWSIRRTYIPKTTVVPIFAIGILTATLILPTEYQDLLSLAKMYVLPLVEGIVLLYVGGKVYAATRRFNSHRSDLSDTYDAITTTCSEIAPPKLARILSTELGVIYYILFSWRAKAKEGYSYHKRNGSIALLGAFSFIIMVEVFVMHILLERWSPLAAWILTGLSIYSLLQVVALMRSIYLRPALITSSHVLLQYGFFKECKIALSDIKCVTFEKRIKMNEDAGITNFSLLGEMESANVLIECYDPVVINGPYGMKSNDNKIALSIDNAQVFVDDITKRLSA